MITAEIEALLRLLTEWEREEKELLFAGAALGGKTGETALTWKPRALKSVSPNETPAMCRGFCSRHVRIRKKISAGRCVYDRVVSKIDMAICIRRLPQM